MHDLPPCRWVSKFRSSHSSFLRLATANCIFTILHFRPEINFRGAVFLDISKQGEDQHAVLSLLRIFTIWGLQKEQQADCHDHHTGDQAVDGQMVLPIFPGSWEQFVKGNEPHNAGYPRKQQSKYSVASNRAQHQPPQ